MLALRESIVASAFRTLIAVAATISGNITAPALAQQPEFRWVNKLPESRTPGLVHGTYFSQANHAYLGNYLYLPTGYGDA